MKFVAQLSIVLALSLLVTVCTPTPPPPSPTRVPPTSTPLPPPPPDVSGWPLVLEDDFDDPESGFPQENYDVGSSFYHDGRYIIEVTKESWLIWERQDSFSDFVMEVDVIPQEEAGAAGVVFRLEGKYRFYVFQVSTDGHYKLLKLLAQGGEDWETILDWRESPHIKTGLVTNRLRVVCVGSEIWLYANDHYLDTVQDTSFTTGEIGMIAGTAFGESYALFHFDNLQVYAPLIEQTFDDGKIKLSGTQAQIDKIEDVIPVEPDDPRYPNPDEIGTDVEQVLHVFEIELKSEQDSITPPSLTLEEFRVEGELWDSIEPKDKTLYIYRYISAGNWEPAGEAWLKKQRPYVWGIIDHASLLALVEPSEVDEFILEGVRNVVGLYDPRLVWIGAILTGADAPRFVEAGESTVDHFSEFGVEVVMDDMIGPNYYRDTLERTEGYEPDVGVFFLPQEDWEEALDGMDELGLAFPVFAYDPASGENWQQLRD